MQILSRLGFRLPYHSVCCPLPLFKVHCLQQGTSTGSATKLFVLSSNCEPILTNFTAGRTVLSCQHAFNNIRSRMPQPDPKAKKLKRPIPIGEIPSAPGRSIQPRPSAFAPINPNGQDPLSPSEGDGRPRKKRGRPSKVEHEQRVREAEARGEVYPPPRKPKTPRPSLESGPLPAGPGAPMAVMFTPHNTAFQGLTSPGSAYQRIEPEVPTTMEPPGTSIPKDQLQRSPFAAERPPRSTIPETQMSDFNASESLVAELHRQAAQAETPTEAAQEPAQEKAEELAQEPIRHPVRDSIHESTRESAPIKESTATQSTATLQGSYTSGSGHLLPGPLYSGQHH